MKALILGATNSRNAGGIFHILYMLGRNLLANKNNEVHFLLHDDEYSEEDRKSYGTMTMHTYTVIGPSNFGYSMDVAIEMAKIKPDIIHSHGIWMYFSHVNKQYCIKTKTPYVISPQGMLDPWQLKQSFAKDLKKKLALQLYERAHLRHATCILALCQSEYQSIRAFGLKNPIAIIPNGTDLPLITDRTADYPIPCRWDQDGSRKTLLFLSRIHVKKGLDNLLQAWALTKPAQHSWQLVIAGETKDSAYWNSLHKQMHSLNIEDTVQFIGGQFGVNKETCFVDADAFILPSFSEGLPMAVLEALSYKLPALITQYCNVPSAFEYHAALAIDTTPESIAAGINKLMNLSEAERQRIGENGYNLVKEKFTWEKVALYTQHLYQWILGKETQPDFVKLD